MGSGGAGSQEAEAGSPLQETLAVAGVGQYCGPWAGRRGCPSSAKQGRQERVPAMAYHSAREEGTVGAGTLGEESLRRPYMPPSRDWCVPH